MNKRRGLGRGLEALIPSGEYVEELSDNRARRRFALQIAIAEIKPNPEQPRRSFDPASLQELADSIRIHGILQRTDLNAIEEARAIQRLLRDFGLTQEALAERIGKNRVTIAQSVRLLGLPEPAIKAIESGAITAGHGSALLGLATAAQQLDGLERVIKERW